MRMWRRIVHSIGVTVALRAGYRQLLRRCPVPVKILSDSLSRDTGRASRLIVMLPGVYNLPEDFIDKGFIAALRAHGVDADVIMADVHFGYFSDRTAVARIHDDIVIPARKHGYRDIWLVGISLGGFGALAYASVYANHADQINGLFVIAPFPGTGDIIQEIRSLGGPLPWSQTAASEQGDERIIWRWLAAQHRIRAQQPVMYFGTGTTDRYIGAQRMLAELLPPAHCRFIEGGHTWETWQQLWHAFLDDGPWSIEPLAKRPLQS
ncbi:MAG TPA: alpha/beta hydrolase [Rhodocyclaceae bacterium]|nr:alpha/beta hydrolase [Rhodocyclaceae bacterium]